MPRLTTAQALVRFLAAQQVERDGERHRLVEGCLGIFGHGNVAGLGEALQSHPELLPYRLLRNEQAMVHAAAGFARERRRLSTLACTTSIGPGATNLVTGAAAATVNRLPVLLLPGDVFASRVSDPVLQQLETPWAGDISVNDCLRPVSRYFDRVTRPEQLIPAALAAMRVLTDPAETGAVTLALPQDVQVEAHDFPDGFLAPRVWSIRRPQPDPVALAQLIALIRAARRPLIVAGGGVIYADAADALAALAARTGIPVGETQAGRGALPDGSPGALGAIGATGTLAANRIARDADLVIGIGTRWTDFTTASQSAFQAPDVLFVNVNIAPVDAVKQSALAILADARVTLELLSSALADHRVDADHRERIAAEIAGWRAERDRLSATRHAPLPSQAEVIGAVNDAASADDVVVSAAGSLPGDLHKLWRSERAGDYHVEYGFSTMGYEIAGALGVKLAAPDREVFVLVGDGSYLMLSAELATAVQERLRLVVVLVDNRGFASIGALSRSVGGDGFGTRYRYRDGDRPDGDHLGEREDLDLPVDLATNAESLGAHVIRAGTIEELRAGLEAARRQRGPVVITIRTDRYAGVPACESWWDVPIAETSDRPAVRAARSEYLSARRGQRRHLTPPGAR